MSATEVHSPGRGAAAGTVGMHFEVDIIPVSDVDRAKQFYQRLGWRLDADVAPLEGLRIVQFTPPGSGASVNLAPNHDGRAGFGRIDAAGTAFASAADLAGAFRRAEAARREHEKGAGRSHLFHHSGHDGDWPAWYAAYLAAEQAGTDLPA
jgi:catechol 2,3-dioxygenase-like lactoylglutathione lyase family enzyme